MTTTSQPADRTAWQTLEPTDPPLSVWVVSLSAVNLGLVTRREREPVWSSTVFPDPAPAVVGVDKALP